MDKDVVPHDPVNHPSHYTSHPAGIECIDVIRPMRLSIGSSIKYLWRAGLKGGGSRDKEIQDLEKAIWYINDRIQEIRREKAIEEMNAKKSDPLEGAIVRETFEGMVVGEPEAIASFHRQRGGGVAPVNPRHGRKGKGK